MSSLAGPQSLLSGASSFARDSDLGMPPREDLRDLRDDRTLLNENSELKHQNEFMRSLVARLQEFLKLYQARYPELQISESSVNALDDGGDQPPWITHSRYLSPLLVAYEARLKELDIANQAANDECLRLQSAVTQLSSQNEQLQSQMEQQIGALLRRLDNPAVLNQLTGSGGSGGGGPTPTGMTPTPTGNATNEDVRELQQHMELLMQEGDLMRDQEQVFRKEIANLTADLADKTDACAKLAADADAQRALRVQLAAELQRAATAHLQIDADRSQLRASLAATEADRDRALQAAQASKLEAKQIAADLLKRTQAFDELQGRYHSETNRMLLDAKQSAATLARLSQEHDKYKSECDRLSDQQRSIELAAATHRRDNEHLVRRCADVTHEVTLKDDQLRLLRNALNEAKEAKDQAMTERDAALTRDEAARREVARLDERLKTEISDVKRACESDKARYFEKIKEREEKLRDEARQTAVAFHELEEQRDKCVRERQVVEAALARFSGIARAEQAALGDRIHALQAKQCELQNERDLAVAHADQARAEMQATNDLWSRERAALELTNGEFRRLLDAKDIHLASLKAENARLDERVQSASAAHASLSARISQMEKTHAERSAQAHAVFKRDLAAWQATADDARAAQRRAESAAQDLVALSARAEQTTRSEVQQMVAAHTKRCAELKEAQHRANVRVDELESVNAQMRRERDEAVRRQAEADQALSQATAELHLHQRRAHETAVALAACTAREQRLLQEHRTLTVSSDRAELERRRLARQLEQQQRRAERQQLLASAGVDEMESEFVDASMHKSRLSQISEATA